MKTAKQGRNAFGLGVAACAACCAGPILAAIGGATAFIGVATLVAGAAGLGVALVVAVGFAARWRRRECAPMAVAVEAPTRREKVRDLEPLVTEELIATERSR